jgi:tRNA A-37 threonylcarbamoyl transferase component Bud32
MVPIRCVLTGRKSWAKVLVLEFVKGESLGTILDDMIENNPAGADQETDKVSTFMMSAYDSVGQIHQANVTHKNTEAHKCLVKENGKFCWLDFTRAQRLDFEEDSHVVDLLKYSDLGRINNFLQRVCYDLEISYKFDN